MKNEQALLENMLAASKISDEDYKLLSAALDKKVADSFVSLLINPFQKIAGFYALVIGMIIIVSMSYLGVIANVFFDGVTGATIASSFKNAKIQPNFFFLLYENLLSLSILTI